jgi:hypothetical protein
VRALDWRGLLTEHGVRFVERGANVKRGEINIRCPFCGSADPSFHMGLNLESGFWACWRNSMHRGKSPVRLLTRLLDLPYWKARRLAGLEDREVDPDGFDAMASRLLGRDSGTQTEHLPRRFLEHPDDHVPILEAPGPYLDYVRRVRCFQRDGLERLGAEYGVLAAFRGEDRGRIILPYFVDGDLVAWTGRAITQAEIRYKDLPLEECLVPIKQTLYNLDCRLDGGAALVVVEGPIDALKIDCFGRDHSVRAVALSTNSATDEQTYLIEDMAPEFSHVFFMMDHASSLSIVDSMRMRARMRSIRNASTIEVPYGLKDAGEMTPRQVRNWAKELTQ